MQVYVTGDEGWPVGVIRGADVEPGILWCGWGGGWSHGFCRFN